ncbi:MAG: sulfatase-like hydrolase/transferase [Acidobacteriota bacterium]|nr:sulfatase-like hydrolase/transferase [Acidobacteriota bacterium]
MAYPRWLPAALPAILLALMGASCSSAPPRAGLDSLLLITVDTLRADHLGCYDPRTPVPTPRIDTLAAEGLLARRAWTTVPITAPSHATILSGLGPLAHGVRNNYRYRLPGDVPTLATILGARGRRTAAFVAAYTASRDFGLDHGFELFDDDLGVDAQGRPRSQRPGDEVVDRALRWIEAHGSQPFFVWVHLFDPHSPYEAPEPHRSAHPTDPYAGEVAFTDAQVGRLLDALAASPAAPHTVTALVADHGESLGEHGEEEHGMLLYEATIRVPLLIRAPGRITAGSVIEGGVSTTDLAPTLLGLLDVTPGEDFEGRDLLADPPSADRPLYTESIYAHEELGWSPLYGLRQGDWVYIAAPREELYDLATDPAERHNLAAEHPERTARMRTTLEEMQRRRLRAERIQSALGSGGQLEAEDMARLESLGYAAGGAAAPPDDPLPPVTGRNPVDNLVDYQVLIRAQHLILAGQAPAAVRMLRRLNRDDPGNPQYQLKLALALENVDDPAAADATYRELVRDHPSFLLGHRFYAAFLEARRRAEEACALWARFAGAYPEAVGAVAELARCEIDLGRAPRALERLERHVDRHPGDPQAWTQLGRARGAVGNAGGALEAFARALALRGSDRKALDALVTFANASGETRRARRLLESLPAYGKGSAAIRGALARLR